MRYFKYVSFKPTKLPKVLSIDEFKGNSGGQKYNSIVVDAENHKVIDILPSRFENDLIRYFSQFQSKTDVKYFVFNMNPHFREVAKACFPKAVVVSDRYHVIRQVYWAMECVRKNEQNKLSSGFRKYFKKSRCLLMKPMEKLSDEEADKLALMFEIAPSLADAYRLKNEFLNVIRSESAKTGKQKLIDWLAAVEVMDLPEFSDCTKAYRNWFREILNAMDVPWSNAVVSRFMRKFDSGIWQKSITGWLRRPPWLRLDGRGAKGQGRQPLVLPLTLREPSATHPTSRSCSMTSRCFIFMYFLQPHWVPATWRSLAQTSFRAELPSGNVPTTRVLRRISRFSRSITLLVRMRVQCSPGKSQ